MAQSGDLSRLLKLLLRSSNPWIRGAALLALLVFGLAGVRTFKAKEPASPAATPKASAEATTVAAPARPLSTSSRAGYEKLSGARYVENRGNDGDSFRVRHGHREFELRLYFVDCPEKYLNHRYPEQQARVKDQGKDLGLSVEATVALGLEARDFVRNLLAGKEFTIYTKWEHVYDSERVYGFVELPDPDRPGKTSDLCEILMRRGLGRVHTKGADLPDGRNARDYEDYLLRLQKDQHPAGQSRR